MDSIITIKKTSAADEVFQVIHQRIISGELKLGHRFPPQEVMAEQMGVSRSTIREAINKLILLGFLTTKPGVGTTVVGDGSTAFTSALSRHIFLNSGQVPQFIEARLYLEKAAVRLAILRAEDEDFEAMENLLARQVKAFHQNDSAFFSDLDARFHRRIVESSKNQMLLQFLDLIWDGLSRFILEVTMFQSAVENAIHYHQLLLKQLKERNLIKAEKILVEHLRDVALNIERNLGRDSGLKDMFDQELAYGYSLPEKSNLK